jgi:hypothetical protein
MVVEQVLSPCLRNSECQNLGLLGFGHLELPAYAEELFVLESVAQLY